MFTITTIAIFYTVGSSKSSKVSESISPSMVPSIITVLSSFTTRQQQQATIIIKKSNNHSIMNYPLGIFCYDNQLRSKEPQII